MEKAAIQTLRLVISSEISILLRILCQQKVTRAVQIYLLLAKFSGKLRVLKLPPEMQILIYECLGFTPAPSL
jgi:hypothetical protein